jgi:cell division protein FtsI (penicillin-binding protein 3)
MTRTRKKKEEGLGRRHLFVGMALIVWMCAIIWRLYSLQIVEHGKYRDRALSQRLKVFELAPPRGDIVDRNGVVLAQSVISHTLVADPELIRESQDSKEKIEKAKSIAHCLAEMLGDVNAQELYQGLSRDSTHYVRLRRRLNPEKVAAVKRAIEQYKFVGLHFEQEPIRLYPNKSLAAHIVGYVDDEESGQAGLEKTQERYLRGASGAVHYETDARGRPFDRRETPPREGAQLVTTIDAGLQHRVEALLETAWRETRSKAASAIVIDIKTGEVLSLANFPTYDPNTRPRARKTKEATEAELEPRRNRAVTDYYEPGSVFKMVTYSAALEEGLIRPNDKVNCLNGRIELFGRVINDHVSGWLTATEALAKSSNVGAIQMALKVTRQRSEDRFVEYIKRYGFGAVTGIELPLETPGLVLSPRRWHKTSIGSIAIGQEVGVTIVQLGAAMAAIGNGGLWVQPHVVRQAVAGAEKGHEILYQAEPKTHRAVSEKTAREIAGMLHQVVLAGTARHAVKLTGYTAAGKTGTPQKIDPVTKRYSKFMPTFVGFVPVNDPQFAIVVMLDEPIGLHQGGQVSAPVFRSIAETVLLQHGVSPDQPEFRQALELLVARLREKSLETDQAGEAGEDANVAAPPDTTVTASAATKKNDKGPAGTAVKAANGESAAKDDKEPRMVSAVAAAPAAFNPRVMPDFRGRSIREVTQLCTRLDLRVSLIGKGMARRQSPAAGAPIQPGDACRVEFQDP